MVDFSLASHAARLASREARSARSAALRRNPQDPHGWLTAGRRDREALLGEAVAVRPAPLRAQRSCTLGTGRRIPQRFPPMQADIDGCFGQIFPIGVFRLILFVRS